MSIADEIKRERSHLDHLNQQRRVAEHEGKGADEVQRYDEGIRRTEARIAILAAAERQIAEIG